MSEGTYGGFTSRGSGALGPREIRAAALDVAADGAAAGPLTRHAARGPGYGIPVVGTVLLLLGLFLLADTLRRPSVNLDVVPHVKVASGQMDAEIDLPSGGDYGVVYTRLRGPHQTYRRPQQAYQQSDPLDDVKVTLPEGSAQGSTGDGQGTYFADLLIEYWPEGMALKSGSFHLDRPATARIKLLSDDVGGVYLVPLIDTPMRVDPMRLLIDSALVVAGTYLLVWGGLRRRSWTKRAREYAAQVEATQHGPIG